MNAKDSPFYRRAALMVRMIPLVAEEACFALKGGTAINFFVRDLLRLSVDIDLTYLPVEGRTASLDGIAAALDRIAERMARLHPEVRVHRATRPNATRTTKLVVQSQRLGSRSQRNASASVTSFELRALCDEKSGSENKILWGVMQSKA
jgi:hypothetical protein